MTDEPVLQTELTKEIGGSLASVWKRYAGVRPDDVDTVFQGNRVACVVTGAIDEFERGIKGEREDEEAAGLRLTAAGYKREASAAVAKHTRRRVMAVVSDHDADAGTSNEVFILEPQLRKVKPL